MKNTAAAEKGSETAAKRIVWTERFGELEVEEDKVITMKTPCLGFPESRQFVLRPHSERSPFMWLQSLDNPHLAFVVVQPAVFNLELALTLDLPSRQELELTAEDTPDVLVILTIPRGRPQDMTANLLGPLVINVRKRLAKQVLQDPLRNDPCLPVLGP